MRSALISLLALLMLPAAASAQAPTIADPGPCTQAAALGMPEGDDHDHNDPAQHQGLYCRMTKVYFNSLKHGELDGGDGAKFEANAQLGELDIKGDIAAVAVAQPLGGAIFFDVSDPANPKFLSRYVDANCTLNSDCGAYVEMMEDGKWALLGVQQTDLMPGLITGYQSQLPGVKLIDLRDPKNPKLAQEYTTASVEGIHTARSYVIKDGNFAGEYAFFIQNGVGIEIARVQELPTGDKRMVRIANIAVPDSTNLSSIHDTFIQTDPTDGKTYLYGAGGFTTGFIVWDISNPFVPQEVARWDLTPQCVNDWYSHTIDVTTVKGRRIVTMPTENFSFGAQASSSEECGTEQGNGDKPSDFWFVDATDWSKLPHDGDDEATIAKKSADALITTWTNPAGRAGGQLTFSAHNQQIVGNDVLLTNYHGGLFWLDATKAFNGEKVRPKELAWSVPFEPDQRPSLDYGAWVFTTGSFWDAQWYKGYIFGADIAGGVYSLKVDEGDSATQPSCTDQLSPTTTFKAKLTRKGLILTGKALERGCNGKVERVLAALALVKGKKCQFLTAKGKLTKKRACSKPRFITATGTDNFALGLRAKLRKGRYQLTVTAVDGAGNLSRRVKKLKVK